MRRDDLVAKFDVLEGVQRKLREACPQDKLGEYKEGKPVFLAPYGPRPYPDDTMMPVSET